MAGHLNETNCRRWTSVDSIVSSRFSMSLHNYMYRRSDTLKTLFVLDAVLILCTFTFCEWLIYYLTLFQCSWSWANIKISPESGYRNVNHKIETSNKWEAVNPEELSGLRIIFIADPHLLGPYRGHWFDKLRREWQMERAFKISLFFLKPDALFILGDLFDEGESVEKKDWEEYVRRFSLIFHVPKEYNISVHVVAGNHDIGFHYKASEDLEKWERFKEFFDQSSVKYLNIKRIRFVLLNSMALEGDGCSLCAEAIQQLTEIESELNLPNRTTEASCDRGENDIRCTRMDNRRPILLQHFPLYRENEASCTGSDGPKPELATSTNREGLEVVSKESSKLLFKMLQPRVVLSGHAHHGCVYNHSGGILEISVPSFSWRNIDNPSILLGVFTEDAFHLTKCFLPRESTVISTYIIAGTLLVIYNSLQIYKLFQKKLEQKKTQKIL